MKELVDIVKQSQADFVILGGDFNSDPVVNKNETTLKDITDIMVSSINEIFLKLEVKILIKILIITTEYLFPKNWLIPKKATYGNPENTYSYTYSPVHYDYIFHKANHGNMMWTSLFDVRNTVFIISSVLIFEQSSDSAVQNQERCQP